MNRVLFDSPEGEAIIMKIDAICALGRERRLACRDNFLANIKPSDWDWLTSEEREELSDLQLQVRMPTQAEAKERVARKRAARIKQKEQIS